MISQREPAPARVLFCAAPSCGHGSDLHPHDKCIVQGCSCRAFVVGGHAEKVKGDE